MNNELDKLYDSITTNRTKSNKNYISDNEIMSLVKQYNIKYKKFKRTQKGGQDEDNQPKQEQIEEPKETEQITANVDDVIDTEQNRDSDKESDIESQFSGEVAESQIAPNPYTPTKLNTYTIPKGTVLYHGSSKKFFNSQTIELGDNRKSAVGFFSTSLRFASDYVKGCALSNIDQSSTNGYYIHKFEVKEDIPYIYIVTPDVDGEWTLDKIENAYCVDPDNKYLVDGQKLNGIGFAVKKNETAKFTNDDTDFTDFNLNDYDSEFVLCNPVRFLAYVGTSECLGKRRRSEFKNYRS